MSETLEHFLYELKFSKKGQLKKNLAVYETAKLVLGHRVSSYEELQKYTCAKRTTLYNRIVMACDALKVNGSGMNALKSAYIDFLEEEIKMLSGE